MGSRARRAWFVGIIAVTFAGSAGSSPSEARRLSLSRALAIRSHLSSRGVSSLRAEIQALGDRSKGQPADRADLIVMSQ